MKIKLYKMLLHIAPNRFLRDIQAEFNKAYPFLKLEFFTGKPRPYSDLAGSVLLPGTKKIGETQLKPAEGFIDINEQMKVTELETIFREKFKLAAQVFRKSGNIWLETTITDNWTLEQQNKHGQEISTNRPEKLKADDYDLNRDADS